MNNPAGKAGLRDLTCYFESHERVTAGFYFSSQMPRRWITRAEHELAEGKPVLILAVGGELHWVDRDGYRRHRDVIG